MSLPGEPQPSGSLARLQSELADQRGEPQPGAEGWSAHTAVLDRLAANIRIAESRGWTSCAIERLGVERFTAWGTPPRSTQRHEIPDWASE